MELLLEAFRHALMITGFVFVMMLLIEYINVQTQGMWQELFTKKRWLQYILAAALGAMPGCLGAFTVVTLFSHRIVSLGALTAAMIATSGDETFVMLALIPKHAFLIMALTFFIGIAAGFITDKIFPNWSKSEKFAKLPIHKEEKCRCLPQGNIFVHLKQPSMQRILLIIIVLMLIGGLLSGAIAQHMKIWMKSSILFTALIALFICVTVPDHFLTSHLWDHIVKVHIPRIFLWTFGTLLVIHLAMHYVDLNAWLAANKLIILIIAVLVGLIPESGPHLVFVTLFAQGSLPFSILLANSIVQDGHGMIPLLAESGKAFVYVKILNLAAGLIIGLLLLQTGL